MGQAITVFPWGTVKEYAWDDGEQRTNGERLQETPLGFSMAAFPTSPHKRDGETHELQTVRVVIIHFAG